MWVCALPPTPKCAVSTLQRSHVFTIVCAHARLCFRTKHCALTQYVVKSFVHNSLPVRTNANRKFLFFCFICFSFFSGATSLTVLARAHLCATLTTISLIILMALALTLLPFCFTVAFWRAHCNFENPHAKTVCYRFRRIFLKYSKTPNFECFSLNAYYFISPKFLLLNLFSAPGGWSLQPSPLSILYELFMYLCVCVCGFVAHTVGIKRRASALNGTPASTSPLQAYTPPAVRPTNNSDSRRGRGARLRKAASVDEVLCVALNSTCNILVHVCVCVRPLGFAACHPENIALLTRHIRNCGVQRFSHSALWGCTAAAAPAAAE